MSAINRYSIEIIIAAPTMHMKPTVHVMIRSSVLLKVRCLFRLRLFMVYPFKIYLVQGQPLYFFLDLAPVDRSLTIRTNHVEILRETERY